MVGVAPFVGREPERRAIDELLDRARSADGAVVVLTGAADIGKTRLAEQAATDAATSFDVARAACGPAGTMPPFWPWTQILGDLLRRDHDLRAHTEWPGATRLVGARPEPQPTGGVPDHERARAELYEDVVSVLAAARARRAQLLLMDDLQNADPSSWLLLAHLVPRLRSMAVVVLATWRTGDIRPPEPTASALLRQLQRIAVPPLDVDQLGSLLGGVAGRAITAPVAVAVHRRTSGNPLLAQEVMAALAAHGELDDDAAAAAAVPESTRSLVAERLAGLSTTTRAALAAAAVVGATFAIDVVAEALGQDGIVMLDRLGPAADAGMLAALGPAQGGFAHDVVRDVVLEIEPAVVRARLHLAVGDALERLGDAGRPVEPVDLARHFLAAGPGVADRARRYATDAGRRAMAMLAYEEAAMWFAQAAGVAAGGPVDPAERTELLLALGEAREASGDRARARSTYLEAAAAARTADRADLLAMAALGMSGTVGFEVTLLDRQQIDLLEETLDCLAPEDLARRASVMARLAVALSFLDQEDRRLALTREALARASGDPVALVQALAARCDARSGPEHTDARAVLAAEIVDVGTRIREPRVELLGRRLWIVALLEAGDVGGADREIRAFATTAAALRRPSFSWYVPLWRSMRATMDGRIDEAMAFLAEAEKIAGPSGSENAVVLTATLRWFLLCELGDTAAVAEMLAHSGLETFPGVWPLVARALCAALLGRLDAARALLDSAAARLPGAERDSEWLPMVCQVAETVGAIGGHPIGPWAYENLLPHRSRMAVEGIGAAMRGPVERALGLLAATLGHREDAAGHFEAAAIAGERMGASLLVARTRRDAGVSLGDRAQLELEERWSQAGQRWYCREMARADLSGGEILVARTANESARI